jgi:L-fuculose-phosphate aldolase
MALSKIGEQAMPISLIPPCDEIVHTIERIYRNRMTTTSGGNVSIRESSGQVWITPAGIDKGRLRREDMGCVHADGSHSGPHKPSSELPFHLQIYKARPDLLAIIHAHPVALVSFSLVRQVPDTHLFHQLRRVCGDVGFAPYRLPGSAALGESVAETFAQGYNCVILENHGVITAGADLREAFWRFETLEFAAKIIIKAKLLGEVRYLDERSITLPARCVIATPEFQRDRPSSLEKELRRQLCEFVHRAYRQRLVISTQGTFSLRLDTSSFLITPHDVDRALLDVADLVLIANGRSENGKRPSLAVRLHEAIYKEHPQIQAIANAYPVNATAFTVTDQPFDTRTIPESYVVLRTVGRVGFGLQYEDHDSLAREISPRQPVLLLENDGALVTGRSILEAFDRLEVLESTAEALINSRALGQLVPISEGAIRELERVFLGI